MNALPQQFLARMRASLGEEYDAFVSFYAQPAARAVRVNTLKTEVSRFKELCPFPCDGEVPWCKEGFISAKRGPGCI